MKHVLVSVLHLSRCAQITKQIVPLRDEIQPIHISLKNKKRVTGGFIFKDFRGIPLGTMDIFRLSAVL